MVDFPTKTEVLQLLIELWETRSLATASSRMGISPATSFRLLKEARQEFSDPLFVKSGRTMIYTHHMQELVPKIQGILDNISQLKKSEVFNPAQSRRTLRIACIDNGILAFIVPLVDKIFKQSPHIRLSIEPITEHFQLRLANGKLDLAFYAPPGFKPIEGILTHRMPPGTGHVYIVRKGHPLIAKLKKEGKLTKDDL